MAARGTVSALRHLLSRGAASSGGGAGGASCSAAAATAGASSAAPSSSSAAAHSGALLRLAARRYHVDRHGYVHFEPGRGAGAGAGGRQPAARLALLAAGAGAAALYVSSLEEVPVTGRRHAIMLVSPKMERRLGRAMFEGARPLPGAGARCRSLAPSIVLPPLRHAAACASPSSSPASPASPPK